MMNWLLAIGLLVSSTTALDVQLVDVGSGLGQIADIQHEADRLFIVDKEGIISILGASSSFLDISSRTKNSGERGLLGLAFDPNYASNGFLYVNYIHDDGGSEAGCISTQSGNAKNTRISRFTRSSPTTADPTSELVIAELDQPYCNHNGGQIQFGTDGYLYIATGDGGSGNDPQNNGVDLTTLLGKLLRVDVSNMNPSDALPRWKIPPSNPFASNSNARDEIWHYGLRNPWRFSFDSSTNDLWIADVGQTAREEINFVASNGSPGRHFGWRPCEGTRTNFASEVGAGCSCADSSCFVPPILEYGRGQGQSITGGYVYRGADASLAGTYFYADFASNTLWGARNEGGAWTNIVEESGLLSSPSTFGIDMNGEVYVGTLGGDLYRIVADTSSGDDDDDDDDGGDTCETRGFLGICKD